MKEVTVLLPYVSSAVHRIFINSSRRRSLTLAQDDTILCTSSCSRMPNGGLFETILDSWRDAVISDELNHASHHRWGRPCKAKEIQIQKQQHGRPQKLNWKRLTRAGARIKLITTDGVFSWMVSSTTWKVFATTWQINTTHWLWLTIAMQLVRRQTWSWYCWTPVLKAVLISSLVICK